MCGINGVYGLEDRELIEDMNYLIKHRGPDGQGIVIKPDISLGHVRLSIIDLSDDGLQPMCNEDETIWITFNGEIYNYKELNEELKDHTFKSKTDTETMIHLYEKKGLGFINHLRGMFAFALWDSKKQRLILARDPIGKKPLYYYINKKHIVFCSEIKGILRYMQKYEIKIEENTKSVELYKAYQYVPGDETMFKGIMKVLPGQVVVFNQGPNKKEFFYWIIEENQIKDNSIENLQIFLDESVKLRMLASDVPIGCFLSGGLDSSMVLALAKKYVPYKIHTFTLGFENSNEFDYAKQVADYLGTEHHEILLKGEEVAKEIRKIVWHYDEPPADAAIVNNYFLAREARKHVKVVLAGEGGDELFGGYPSYRRSLLYSKIPFHGDLYKFHLRMSKFKDEPYNEEYFLEPIRIKDPLNRVLAFDCMNLLPEKFLMKGDKATMAHSIEERLPLLDKKLIQLAFSLPRKYKKDKKALRLLAQKILPQKIYNRPKHGFGTPTRIWLKHLGVKREFKSEYEARKIWTDIMLNLWRENYAQWQTLT